VYASTPFFAGLVALSTSGRFAAAGVEGPDAIVAWRAMMGATNPMPAAPGTIRGDLATVMQENVTREGDVAVITSKTRVGQSVRKRGEDLRAGAVAIAKGTRLRPAHLALAASLDRAEIAVVRRPEVAFLALACFFSFLNAVVIHNHVHKGIFKSRALNRLFRCALSFGVLYPASANVASHNLVHHHFDDDGQPDWAAPEAVSFRWHLLNLLHFPNVVGPRTFAGVTRWAETTRQKDFRRQLLLEQVFAFGLTTLLLVNDFWTTVFFLLIPVVSVFFSSSLGLLTGYIMRRRGFIAGALILIGIFAYSLWELYSEPSLFVYNPLYGFFPDKTEYARRLARALTYAGKPEDAYEVLASARARPLAPIDDLRLDLMETFVHAKTATYPRGLAAARAAEAKARALGATDFVAQGLITGSESELHMGKLEDALAWQLRGA